MSAFLALVPAFILLFGSTFVPGDRLGCRHRLGRSIAPRSLPAGSGWSPAVDYVAILSLTWRALIHSRRNQLHHPPFHMRLTGSDRATKCAVWLSGRAVLLTFLLLLGAPVLAAAITMLLTDLQFRHGLS